MSNELEDKAAEYSIWQCSTCHDRPEFQSTSEVVSHLRDIHEDLSGTMMLTSQMHWDGQEFFGGSEMATTDSGVVLHHVYRIRRAQDAMMRFA